MDADLPISGTPFAVITAPAGDADPVGGLGLSGEFDLAGLETWRAAVVGRPELHCADVVVDLLLLRFLDATGMGALVGLGNRLRAAGHRLSLVCPAPNVRRALTAGGLEHLVGR